MKKLVYLFLIVGLGLALSCKKDSASLKKVGDKYEGGVIAYLLIPGDTGYDPKVQHGMIATEADLQLPAPWSLNDIVTNVTASGIGNGKANTEAIVVAQGGGIYAAKLCADLSLNGYDDWYLPDYAELKVLMDNNQLIGNFQPVEYWCSEEVDLSSALIYDLSSSGFFPIDKSTTCRIRAIRYF